jgi:hypothetical protein
MGGMGRFLGCLTASGLTETAFKLTAVFLLFLHCLTDRPAWHGMACACSGSQAALCTFASLMAELQHGKFASLMAELQHGRGRSQAPLLAGGLLAF